MVLSVLRYHPTHDLTGHRSACRSGACPACCWPPRPCSQGTGQTGGPRPRAAGPPRAGPPPAGPSAGLRDQRNVGRPDRLIKRRHAGGAGDGAPWANAPRGIQPEPPNGRSLVRRASAARRRPVPGVDPKTLAAAGIATPTASAEIDADTYKLKRIIHAGADPEQPRGQRRRPRALLRRQPRDTEKPSASSTSRRAR